MRGAQTMGSPSTALGLAKESRKESTALQPRGEPSVLHRCLSTSGTQVNRPSDFSGGGSRPGTPKLGFRSKRPRRLLTPPHWGAHNCSLSAHSGVPRSQSPASAERSHDHSATCGGVGGAHQMNAEPEPRGGWELREDPRAEGAPAPWSALLRTPGPRPRPSAGASLASLRDQLN